MKKNLVKRGLMIIVMIAAISVSQVWAQVPGGPKGKKGPKSSKAPMELRMQRMLPDLTDDQMAKIKTLRIEMLKKINPLKAQIAEKRAHIKSLSLADTPDMKAIDKSIDELSVLQAKLMKIMAKFRQDVRATLTADQRAIFDSRMSSKRGSKSSAKCPHTTKP
jgi:Spy/CpxP family protein refolding chaperone